MKMSFGIIYSKIMVLVYPPGILLLPPLLKCGAKHSPSGGRNRKNRVPAHKHALGLCNKNRTSKSPQIRTSQDTFLRNTKNFESRNYQLSRCPGWPTLAGLVFQSVPQKLTNMKNFESHEIYSNLSKFKTF